MWLTPPVISGVQPPTTERADTRGRDCGGLHSISVFVDTSCLEDQLVGPTLPLLLLSHSVVSDPTDCTTPGLPVHHQLPELTQTHVY